MTKRQHAPKGSDAQPTREPYGAMEHLQERVAPSTDDLEQSRAENEQVTAELAGAKQVVLDLRANLERSQSMMTLLRRQLRASAIAQEISKVMSSSLNYQQVIQTILAGIHEALDFDRVIFFTVERETRHLYPSLWVGEVERDLDAIRIPLDASSRVVEGLLANQAVLFEGQQEHTETDQRLLESLGADSFLAVPLYRPRYGESALNAKELRLQDFHGAIWIDNAPTNRPIESDMMETITLFANQAAIAIDNSITYSNLEEKERALALSTEELTREKEFIERVVHNMHEGLLTVDEHCSITFFSRALEEMTGFDQQDVLGRHLAMVDPAVSEETLLSGDWETGGQGEEGEIIRRDGSGNGADGTDDTGRTGGAGGTEGIDRPGSVGNAGSDASDAGTLPVLKRRTLLRDPSGRIATGIVLYQDIAKRKELAQLKADFTSMIVHDLRTPITAIKGFLQLMTMEGIAVADADRDNYYKIMEDSCARMIALVNDVLDISKIEAGRLEIHPEECEITALVEAAIATTEVLANEKGIQLVRDYRGDLGCASVDGFRLEQVMINLLSNAVKFTSESGTITVTARHGNGQLELAVTDTGAGIAPEEIALIFERYKQAKHGRKTKGTGLGLVICKQIVEAHGGVIEVESQVDQGSTFKLVIPVVVEAGQSEAGMAETAENTRHPGRRLEAGVRTGSRQRTDCSRTSSRGRS